jgi:hypothetical protein
MRRLRELLGRGEAPAAVPAPALSAEATQRLDAALARLLELRDVRTVVLTHRLGALQAWRGEGDTALLEVYAAVHDGEDDDLAELATSAAFPSGHVVGGIRFETVATDWRLHTALAEDRPPDRWEELERMLASVKAELEAALEAERLASRPSFGVGSESGAT